tara:strand:- start:261 stop:560 length:300 start_codon:yes stop_codon:yes gene_type:complete
MGKLKQLAEAAADYYQVPLERLTSTNRMELYTRPRHQCQWIAADAGIKKSVIAEFWNLDRSSVHYGCKIVSARIKKSAAERNELKRFMQYAGKHMAAKR